MVLEDESYAAVLSFYDIIQSALISATARANMLHKLDELTPGFQLHKFILPHKDSSSYHTSIPHYVEMS